MRGVGRPRLSVHRHLEALRAIRRQSAAVLCRALICMLRTGRVQEVARPEDITAPGDAESKQDDARRCCRLRSVAGAGVEKSAPAQKPASLCASMGHLVANGTPEKSPGHELPRQGPLSW